jgi:hypothetical protein
MRSQLSRHSDYESGKLPRNLRMKKETYYFTSVPLPQMKKETYYLSEVALRTTGVSPWVKARQPKAGRFA